jgi:hypothetical protein
MTPRQIMSNLSVVQCSLHKWILRSDFDQNERNKQMEKRQVDIYRQEEKNVQIHTQKYSEGQIDEWICW